MCDLTFVVTQSEADTEDRSYEETTDGLWDVLIRDEAPRVLGMFLPEDRLKRVLAEVERALS